MEFYYFAGTNIFGVFNRFVPIFLIAELFEYEVEHKRNFLKIAILLWILIVVVSTITYLNTDGGGRAYTNSNFGSLLGGGYAAAYASALFAVVIFEYILSSKRKKQVSWIIIFVLLVLHVITTNSMITTVALIIGLFLSLFFHGKKEKKVTIKLVLPTMFVMLAIVFVMNARNIGSWIMDFSSSISNPTYAQRIREIGLYLYSNDETFHVGKRISTIEISWLSFLKRPIFGGGYLYANDYMLLKENEIVGNHSELLDLLAKYGLFSIPLLYIYYSGLKKCIKLSSIKIAIPFVASFLIMFCLNPFITDQTNYMLFLLIPLFIKTKEEMLNSETI